MSLNAIDTFVLLFPNEEWRSSSTNEDLSSIVAQLQPNISFAQHLENNFQTLSTHNADQDGAITGFLYVPDLDESDDCYNVSKSYVPANATRQANLPPTDFTLVALAPWISQECTTAYLRAASMDPARAFFFYQPNSTLDSPPRPGSSAWDLSDSGAWKTAYQFPVYAVSGPVGNELMHQIALYSGNMTTVPYGHQISELPGIDPRDYVRVYTRLHVGGNGSLPSLWILLVAVLAMLFLILGVTSLMMHFIQRSRRKSLERRVASGEVNLEALGIKRLTVPQIFIERLPLFTYNCEEKTPPTSPQRKKISINSTSEQENQKGSLTSPKREHQTPCETSTPHDTPISQVVIADNRMPNLGSVLIHKFLPYSQPTCGICLEDFESGVSEIRELPCGHIFHPECIDTLLSYHSSLCPSCKKSAFPIGYCPMKITNPMVRRERNIRKLQSRIVINDEEGNHRGGRIRTRIDRLQKSMQTTLSHSSPISRDAALITNTTPPEPQSILIRAVSPITQVNDTLELTPQRQAVVQQRIRELASARVPIQDPDTIQQHLDQPMWRKTLNKVFPGFS